MADNVNDEKIWATTNSNFTHHHAFTARDGKLRAMCRKNIRPVDGTTEDRLYSKRRRVDQLMLTGTFCEGCWAKVTALVDRRNASMEPAQERHDAGYVAPVDDREELSPFGAGECGKVFSEDAAKICVRPVEHLGLHRNTKTPRNRGAFSWGDNESAAEGPVQEDGQYVSTESDGSGIRFRRLPAGHPSTVTARNKRQLMLWGGTMWSTWTVGNPVGWYGREAAWKSVENHEENPQ